MTKMIKIDIQYASTLRRDPSNLMKLQTNRKDVHIDHISDH